MIRKSKHLISEVFRKYEKVMAREETHHYGVFRADFKGDSIKFSSHRLWTFTTKGITCVECGIQAEFFAKEKHTEDENRYHLNLYALDEDGEEVLMTKDHVEPSSKGGNDHISNYQPMCEPCNHEKGAGE